MFAKNALKLTTYSSFSAMILASVAFLAGGKDADALTAKEMTDNMSNDAQFAYISGVVDGLAFARWLADGKEDTGMACIYDWYLGDDQSARLNAQLDWFEANPDQQVSTLMYALIREECGEHATRRTMLKTAFDRSRLVDAHHTKERVEADKRRKRDFERKRDHRERKEEQDDKAEASAAAFAVAVDTSPPATVQQIAAFDAELTTYDTALIEAIMENEAAMKLVEARLEALLMQAFVMEDGRRVFRTEDGTQVFDEFGVELSPDEIDSASIPDHHTSWEDFSDAKEQYNALKQERQALADYQDKLDAAREQLSNGEITEAELDALQAGLSEAMPDAVRAKLPADHPEARAETENTVDELQAQVARSPSLEGLQGFTAPSPMGT